MANKVLVKFIIDSLKKGYSEGFIKKGLKDKGWPDLLINEAVKEAQDSLVQQQVRIIKKPVEAAEKAKGKKWVHEERKPQKQQGDKTTLLRILSFLGIAILLFGTIGIFYYMRGVIGYTVEGPNGEILTKTCLEEDCSDLIQAAMENAINNIITISIVSILVSLAIVLVHAFIKQKKLFLWIVNILYFLALVALMVMWLTFTNS